MTPALIKSLALLAFLLIQIFSLSAVFIIRYHFKKFSAPNDHRAKKMMSLMTFGVSLWLLISGLFLYFIFDANLEL